MSWLDIATSFVGGGGLAAAVGTITGAVTKYKERKLELRHELAMAPHHEKQWRFELAVMTRQAEREKVMAEHELWIASENAAADMMTSVIDADGREAVAAISMDGMPWWVGAIRTLFRPFLTMCLWTSVVIMWSRSPPESELAQLLAATVANGAGASLGVWFGQRVMGSRPGR